MKYLVFFVVCVFSIAHAQENVEPDAKLGDIYFNSNFNLTQGYKINTILNDNGFAPISPFSIGAGAKIICIPKKFGFSIYFDWNISNTKVGNTVTTQVLSSGGIGPSYRLPINSKTNVIFTALYSYSIFDVRNSINQNAPLSEESFQNQTGNLISISRIAHSAGLRLSLVSNIGSQQVLISAAYLYDLTTSDYKGFGFNGTDGFPSEQNQMIQLSLALRLKEF